MAVPLLNAGLEGLALRCLLGLGHLERRGRRGRPWLTMIRSGAELSHLRALQRALRRAASADQDHYFDWVAGDGTEDVCRLQFRAPELEPLLDLPPAERWARCGDQALAALWLDRGLWLGKGRGALLRVRRTDDPRAALDVLRRCGIPQVASADSGGRCSPYRCIRVGEKGMKALIARVRPLTPPAARFCLRRWPAGRRHGLMALGRALGAARGVEWADRVGFLP